MNMLEAALRYAKDGWPVGILNGKEATFTAHGVSDFTTNISTIRKWFKEHPDANIGIRIGPLHMVVDVDNPSSLGVMPEALGTTRHACTSGEKMHHWYRLPPGVEVPNSYGKVAPGIDIKTGNQYVAVPPSVHPDTHEPYTWLNETCEIALAPKWLVDSAGAHKSKFVFEGERNDYIFEELCRHRRSDPGITEDALERYGHKLNTDVCRPLLPASEVLKINTSVFAKKVTYLRDTLGNVKRFVAYWQGVLRYVIDKEQWIYWNGRYWEEIGKVHLLSLCQTTVETMAREAAMLESKDDRKWAYSCRHAGKIEELKRHVAAQKEFWVRSRQLDANEWLWCCTNGTIDLRTGELRSHTKEDYITRISLINYVPDAKYKRWDEFLKEALPNAKTREFIWRSSGYSMTGSTKEEMLFFIIGKAGTGKSTFVESVREVFGMYAVSSRPRDFLTSGKRSGATPEVARLAGARLAVSSEVPASERLNEEVKALVDGTMLSARDLYKSTFQFKPVCKIWLTANYAPRFALGDTGIERRVRVIPFEQLPIVADPTLKEQFRSKEAQEAILVWLVKGCLAWQKRPLTDAPPEVMARTEEYFKEQNPFVDWYEECCEEVDGMFLATKDIEDSIADWAFGKRRKVYVTSKIIARAMKQFGHKHATTTRRGVQRNGYKGLRLRKTTLSKVQEAFD